MSYGFGTIKKIICKCCKYVMTVSFLFKGDNSLIQDALLFKGLVLVFPAFIDPKI